MTTTSQQIQAAFQIMRRSIDATGWGGWVSNDKLMTEAKAVADAVVAASPKPTPAPVPQPASQAQSKGD